MPEPPPRIEPIDEARTRVYPPCAGTVTAAPRSDPAPDPPRRTLIVDFDGTVTLEDMLDRIARQFGDAEIYKEVEWGFRRGEVTMREDIERKLGSVRAPLAEVVAWQIEHARMRRGFAGLVGLARAREWPLVVVSSSFHELIEPLLAHHGVGAPVHANRVAAEPDGWRVEWRFGVDCDTCGESCKRSVIERLAGSDEAILVGDGYSDRCAARVADRVFATKGLAHYLECKGVRHHPFTDFQDVARALHGGSL